LPGPRESGESPRFSRTVDPQQSGAWRRRGLDNRRIDPALRTFDAADADRLERLTLDLLAAVD
jgi:hypothetical protein